MIAGKPQGAYLVTPSPTSLAELLPTSDSQLVAFLESLLTYDPASRPSAAAALQHPFLVAHRERSGARSPNTGVGRRASSGSFVGDSPAELPASWLPASPTNPSPNSSPDPARTPPPHGRGSPAEMQGDMGR